MNGHMIRVFKAKSLIGDKLHHDNRFTILCYYDLLSATLISVTI